MLKMVEGALLENKELMPSILNLINKERDASLSMAYSLLIQRFD